MYVIFKFSELLPGVFSFVLISHVDNITEAQTYFTDPIITNTGCYIEQGGNYLLIDLSCNSRLSLVKDLIRKYKLEYVLNI